MQLIRESESSPFQFNCKSSLKVFVSLFSKSDRVSKGKKPLVAVRRQRNLMAFAKRRKGELHRRCKRKTLVGGFPGN